MSMNTACKVLWEGLSIHGRSKVSHLILHVTKRCNFRCNHCFVDFTESTPELGLAEIATLAETVNDLIWLDIGGGEPFLRDDLAEIVALFRVRELSIPTNAWMTDKIIGSLDRICKVKDPASIIITISLDGLPATHDMVRNKPGSFERVRATYAAIRSNFPGMRVKFNTVLHQQNVQDIVPLMELVQAELDPTFHSLLFLRGSPNDAEYALPPAEDIVRIEQAIERVQKRYDYGRKGILASVQRNYQKLKLDLDKQIVEQKRQVIPCLAGRAHLVVYADGGVAPCELLPTVGSIAQTPLPQLMASPAWSAALQRIRAGKCHCTHDCNMLENILFNPRLYPRLLKS